MTKPLIKLPSVELREAKEAPDKAYAEIADNKATIADKDAEIAGKDAELADKDAEIARLRELLLSQGIPSPQA